MSEGTAARLPLTGGRAPSLARIELHTHLEGSVTPARLRALAERHGRPDLPGACLDATGRSFSFTGFHGFLELYKRVTSVMRTPRDFHELALDLADQLQADGVTYAEISVSYGVLLARGLDPVPVQAALGEASHEALATRGVALRWLPDAVRHFGLEAAWLAWECAARAGRAQGVVGFGLGGDETSGPASGFAALFAAVRQAGLGVSLHAGEVTAMGEAARDSVRQAVDTCGAMRLGHGLAAAADPSLLRDLAARGIFVELCPRSNVATGAVPSLAVHPLPAFLAAGVPCCLNTDDRTLFGLDLRGEYAQARAVLGLTEAQEAGMREAALCAAFDPAAAAAALSAVRGT
ncbi:MAG: adenosine deaminase [bacterium]|nr:adenosine deaminase [bacterium]